MKPKSKGAGIMPFDLIDEHNGFLAVSDSEYEAEKSPNPQIHQYVCSGVRREHGRIFD